MIMTQEEKEVLRLYNERNGTSLDETNWIERLDWRWISANQTLSEPFMERHAERLDWEGIFYNQRLSEPFMDRHAKRLDWEHISYNQTLSEPFMEKHAERLNWWWVSANQTLSEPFMDRHAERLDWRGISRYQVLSEPFMDRHAERLDWRGISRYQRLSEPLMDRHAKRLDWFYISRYQVLSEPLMDRHAERLDWFYISRHHRLSDAIIEKHADKLPENLRENNWLYADRQEKIRHIRERAPEFSIQEDEHGPFILAWKATHSGGRSDFDPALHYAVGETHEARCDCRMDEKNSFGLSAWTEEGAREFIPGGELYRVKIYIDDIGAMVHDGKKIRCRRQTFVERVK